ncbi:MAG: SpoIID/LytB domain-containing protein [Bryobacter sp.]|nr:SpoIID/LytB domain-containing protein [Bryobacter sp.]
MRLFWASLALSSCLGAAERDLSSYFTGRTGSALLWDLERDELAAAWNAAQARSQEVPLASWRKAFVFATMLEQGVYREDERVACREGALNAVEALAYSCNEYFAKMEPRLDLARGFARLGLDSTRRQWRLSELLPAWKRLVSRRREARLEPLFRGLRQAVEYGTARLAAPPGLPSGIAVAGKTGTMLGTALFAGYAPLERPKYLLLIHLGSGAGGITGGGDAAPFAAKIFGDLLAQTQRPSEAGTVRVRLFWRRDTKGLNLKPGDYPEGTEIRLGNSRLRAPGKVNVKAEGIDVELPLETYVQAVMEGEAGGFRHKASREAMAVAARTYAARFRGRHSHEGFDFCDTTHCQDARFVEHPSAASARAVEATAGELIWWQGKAAAAYYHADSGGWLETGEEPYLKSRRDPWWRDEGQASWQWRVRALDLAAALHLTRIRPQLEVRERLPSGRVKALSVFGHPAEGMAFRSAVGRLLGWEKLPSRLFSVETKEGKIVFSGKGRGHGWGLPQTSAERMAAAGKTYREILAEYYPGTAVGITARGFRWKLLEQGKLRLFTTEEAKDGRRLGEALTVWQQWERDLAMAGNASLRFYPDRAAFQNATGITAKVQGATRGKTVFLLSGATASTLRHELLHALLEQNTRQRHPAWFREGLVEYWNGEKSEAALRVQRLGGREGRQALLRYWRGGLPADKVQ